jgi:hypothetical protein
MTSACAAIKALCFRGEVAAFDTDDARIEAQVRKKVRADLAQARVWDPQFATLSPALADRKLCEYTRVLQLSALEQRVYATIEAKPDAPEPVARWKKYLAWLTVAGITLYPMCVSQSPPPPHASYRRHRLVFPLRFLVLPPRDCFAIGHRACASSSFFEIHSCAIVPHGSHAATRRAPTAVRACQVLHIIVWSAVSPGHHQGLAARDASAVVLGELSVRVT